MSDIFNMSLKDFLLVIKKSWRIILIFSGAAFFCTLIYLLVAPNLYLATGQFQLSQVRAANDEWINLEDPNILIARLKSPTSISDKTLLVCQYPSTLDLTKNIHLGLIKTSPPILEVGIKNRSPELSKACLEVLIDEIKASQNSLIAEKSARHQELTQDYLTSLNKLKREYSQLQLSRGNNAVVDEIFFRERIRLTTEKIFTLDSFIRSAADGSGKLLSPIYVSPSPVSPKRFISLAAGMLLGIFIGLFIGIFKYVFFPRIKAIS